VRTAWGRHVKPLREAGSKYLNAFISAWKASLSAWRIVWPSKGSGLCHLPFCCGGVFALQCFLRWLFPNILANLTERLQSPAPLGAWCYLQMACTFACLLLEYLCERLQSWLWLPVAMYSENNITIRAMEEAVKRQIDRDELADGGLVVDLGKGASPGTCLEIVLFTWIPIVADLVITVLDIWWKLGSAYGLCNTTIALSCICLIIYYGRRLVPVQRKAVKAKRNRDSIMWDLLTACKSLLLTLYRSCMLGSPTARAWKRFKKAQVNYQDRTKESKTTENSQNIIPYALFYTGFFAMAALFTAQHNNSRVRNFTVVVTYMMRLQSPLKSLSVSVPKFIGHAVNFERVYKWLGF
jgi:ABC-type multidrug transport system fused ATPase/permease subunit